MLSDPEVAALVQTMLHEFGTYCGFEPVELSTEKCVLSLVIRPEHLNLHGSIHGGLIAAIMDNSGGILAAFAHGECRTVVTSCQNVFYLSPISGERLYAVAKPVKIGHTLARTQVGVYDDKDSLCAVGYVEYAYCDKR